MSGGGLIVPTSAINNVKYGVFTASLAQAAATYDLFTATGDVMIKRIAFYNDAAAAGLVSAAIATNDTVPVAYLAAVLLAALTGGLNLTAFAGPSYLKSTKKAQYTIVGLGTAGTIKAFVEYMGGDLA